jgi:HTH-type transcriptional regulator / antitoxin HipB
MPDTIRTKGQLGPVLKRSRKAKGWSQFDLGKRIGLSQERISVIENHPERITVDQLLTVLMALEAELQIEHRTTPATTASEPVSVAGTLTTKPRGAW